MKQALLDAVQGMRVVSCSLQTSGYIPGQIRLICRLYRLVHVHIYIFVAGV